MDSRIILNINKMEELILQLKKEIIEVLNLEEVKPEDIDNDASLFGEGLGLDSIDALELIVLIEKNYTHHGAVAFGHYGKALYEVFKYIGVPVEDINFNQPKGMMYPTENPFC